jgi:hypothetical protein
LPTSSPDKPQLDKFKDAARALDCDDDDERFKARVTKLVTKKAAEPAVKDNEPRRRS